MNVGNIMPADEIEIKLSYTELLVPTDGVYEFVFPTVVSPRYSNEMKSENEGENLFIETPYLPEGKESNFRYVINAFISTGILIQEISSPSHHILIKWNSLSEANISLDKDEMQAGNKDYILKFKLMGEKIGTGLLLYKGEEENFFLYMVQLPNNVSDDIVPPRE